jgi:drug/metabolite transporter (DMT)-like permease
MYDEPWSPAERDRYFAHLEHTHRSRKRTWGGLLAIFLGFFLCLWAESWNNLQWITAGIIFGYLLICAVVFACLIRSSARK